MFRRKRDRSNAGFELLAASSRHTPVHGVCRRICMGCHGRAVRIPVRCRQGALMRKNWRSVLVFVGAGLLVGVIQPTAAGLATPLFILMLVIVCLHPMAAVGLRFPHLAAARSRQKRVVAARRGTGNAGPACEWCMVCGSHRDGVARQSGVGRFCAVDLGVYRVRLPERQRRTQQIWPKSAVTACCQKLTIPLPKRWPS